MANEAKANLDEKYRPRSMNEIVGQPHVQAKIQEWVNRQDIQIPHLLFAGPPGVGKTSTAMALAKDLYGKEWRNNFQEFNASDDRGIDFIRSQIKILTGIMPVGAKFQIVFLDEADELTHHAQAALRQIMMKHTDSTKFILSCNEPDKIIEPLKDRCIFLHFKPIASDVIVEKLKVVCESEHFTYEEGTLEILANASNGSLRKAIQKIAEYRSRDSNITMENVKEERVSLETQKIGTLVQKILDGDTESAEKQLFRLHYEDGLAADKLFTLIIDEINSMDIQISLKQMIIDETGKYAWRISSSEVNKHLQIRCYLNSLAMIAAKNMDTPVHSSL